MRTGLWLSVVMLWCMTLGCGSSLQSTDAGSDAGGSVSSHDAGGATRVDGGAPGSGIDGGVGANDAGSCVGKKLENETCTNNAECCGYPSLACSSVGNPGGPTTCVKACEHSSECGSGCCFSIIGVPNGYCAAASMCLPRGPVIDAGSVDTVTPVTGRSCGLPSSTCSSNGDCCGYSSQPRLSACVSSPNAGLVCAAECSTGADCVSGCCVPIENSVDRLCSHPSRCR